MEEHLRGVLLPLAVDTLDDIERARIAMYGRIGRLNRSRLPDNYRDDVKRIIAIARRLSAAEKAATQEVRRVVKRHPLYPWAKAHKVGDKEFARLLAAIGDPFVQPDVTYDGYIVEPARPRQSPEELKAYCGIYDMLLRLVQEGQDSNRHSRDLVWKRLCDVAAICVETDGSYRDVYECAPKDPDATLLGRVSALRMVCGKIVEDLFFEAKRIYEQNGWLEETT